jgi:hypothetical protein
VPVEKVAQVSAGQNQRRAYEPNRSFVSHLLKMTRLGGKLFDLVLDTD